MTHETAVMSPIIFPGIRMAIELPMILEYGAACSRSIRPLVVRKSSSWKQPATIRRLSSSIHDSFTGHPHRFRIWEDLRAEASSHRGLTWATSLRNHRVVGERLPTRLQKCSVEHDVHVVCALGPSCINTRKKSDPPFLTTPTLQQEG